MALEQRRAVYNVDGQALTFVKAESYKGPLLVNTFGAYTLELRFSREWKEFDRIALYLQAAGAAGITLDLTDPLNARKLSETDTQVIYLVNVPSQILKSIGQITVGVTGYKSNDTSFRFPTTLDSSFKVTQSTPNMEAEVLPQQVSVVEKIFLRLYAELGADVSEAQIQAAVNKAIAEGKISNYDDTEIKQQLHDLDQLVVVTNAKNLYDKTKLYTGTHFKYGSSSGYYFLNDEPKYSTVFIPVKENTKYTLSTFNFTQLSGVTELENWYLSTTDVEIYANGGSRDGVIGDGTRPVLTYNDGKYSSQTKVTKNSFTTAQGTVVLALTGDKNFIEELYCNLQLELGEGTDNYVPFGQGGSIIVAGKEVAEKNVVNALSLDNKEIKEKVESLERANAGALYNVLLRDIKFSNLPVKGNISCNRAIVDSVPANLTKTLEVSREGVVDASNSWLYGNLPVQGKQIFVYGDFRTYIEGTKTGTLTFRFMYNGKELCIAYRGQTRYRLLVDEGNGFEYVDEDFILTNSTNDGGYHYIHITFNEPKLRRIKLETTSWTGNIYYESGYSVSAIPEERKPKAYFLGSSITEGSAVTDFEFYSWSSLLSNMLGFEWMNGGCGATGLINGSSGGRYSCTNRLPLDVYPNKPDILFVGGSINDTSYNSDTTSYKQLVNATLKDIKTNIPETLVILLGTFHNISGENTGDLINTVLKETAKENKIPFIDYQFCTVYDKSGNVVLKDNEWIDSVARDRYWNMSADNTHPNREGHKYLAYKMAVCTMAVLNSYKK